MDNRKQAFVKSSAEDKSNLFKAHLIIQLNKYPNLSKEQKDLILEAISLATPQLYKTTKGTDTWEKVNESLKSFNNKALKVFSKEEGSKIFAILGEKEQPVASQLSKPICNCSNDSDWCSQGECYKSDNSCAGTDGCGTLWMYPCNGLCSIPDNPLGVV